MRPDAAGHGKKIRPGIDQRARVIDGDPADRDAGQFEHTLPPSENLWFGMMLDRLGRRRIKGSKSDIVRPRLARFHGKVPARVTRHADLRSEEHTSELQSLMRISYAVFCLKKKKTKKTDQHNSRTT